MATKKVIYFTAGAMPTSNELADIAKLNAAALPAYDVQVWKAGTPQSTPIRAADFVGHDGAVIPAEYSAVAVIDPDDIPLAPLPATQAIVLNAGTVNVENSAGNLDSPATAVVAASVLTSVKLAATKTIVTSGVDLVVPVTGVYATKATPTVVNGVITGIVLS